MKIKKNKEVDTEQNVLELLRTLGCTIGDTLIPDSYFCWFVVFI